MPKLLPNFISRQQIIGAIRDIPTGYRISLWIFELYGYAYKSIS